MNLVAHELAKGGNDLVEFAGRRDDRDPGAVSGSLGEARGDLRPALYVRPDLCQRLADLFRIDIDQPNKLHVPIRQHRVRGIDSDGSKANNNCAKHAFAFLK